MPRQNSSERERLTFPPVEGDARAVMIRGILLAIGTLRAVFLSQADLVLENLALRQQLAAFARNRHRPRIVAADRLFWLVLRRLWFRWSDVLVFVKPAPWSAGTEPVFGAIGPGSRSVAVEVDRRSMPASAH